MNGTRKTCVLALALALLATMAFAATARALPAKFWGVVPQSTLSAEQFQRLARGGVRSVRLPFNWGEMQNASGGPIDWSGVDVTVEGAVQAGIDVLPTISGAPTWAVPSAPVQGGMGSRAPAHLPVSGPTAGAWKSFLAQAVGRYGPGGQFWATHPSLPVKPIRAWQIWNEPNFKYFVARPNPTEYGKLVKLSSTAIGSVDPGAQVILAGMFSQPKGSRTPSGKHKSLNWFASDFLERMYKTNPGIKSRFNGVALHPYTGTYKYLPVEIEEIRTVLTRNRDAAKGLWLTELGWSSQAPSAANIFAKGPSGQASQLRGAFSLLRAKQAKWRLQRIYWFSVDDAPETCNFCNGSGLFGEGFRPKRAWYEFVKFAGGTP